MNTAGQGEGKTPNARARRASRKPAEVLDPDDPEFDAKLDASIERAYERIEDELNRMIEDLDTFRTVPVHIGTVGTKIPARQWACGHALARWQVSESHREHHREHHRAHRAHWHGHGHHSAHQSARDTVGRVEPTQPRTCARDGLPTHPTHG